MIKTATTFTALALIAAMPLSAQPLTPAELPARISVSGTMVSQIAPDIIVWNLGITERATTLKEAKTASDTSTAGVLDVIKGLKVPPADVQTGQLNVQREYNRDVMGNQTPKGWAVSRSITVRQHDLSRFDDFFARLVDTANMEVNFSFESSRYHELRRETRLKAVEIAKQKAQALCEALGNTLGPPIGVEEGPAPAQAPWMPAAQPTWAGSNGSAAIAPVGGSAADAATGTLAPGMMEIRETVSVTFKIQ
jgi:uncharacterized protein YggE